MPPFTSPYQIERVGMVCNGTALPHLQVAPTLKRPPRFLRRTLMVYSKVKRGLAAPPPFTFVLRYNGGVAQCALLQQPRAYTCRLEVDPLHPIFKRPNHRRDNRSAPRESCTKEWECTHCTYTDKLAMPIPPHAGGSAKMSPVRPRVLILKAVAWIVLNCR